MQANANVTVGQCWIFWEVGFGWLIIYVLISSLHTPSWPNRWPRSPNRLKPDFGLINESRTFYKPGLQDQNWSLLGLFTLLRLRLLISLWSERFIIPLFNTGGETVCSSVDSLLIKFLRSYKKLKITDSEPFRSARVGTSWSQLYISRSCDAVVLSVTTMCFNCAVMCVCSLPPPHSAFGNN